MTIKQKCPQRGFTIIELLVVMAVMALLASVVLVSLNETRVKARDTKRIANFRQITTAMELFYAKYGVYPCGDAFDTAGNFYKSGFAGADVLDGVFGPTHPLALSGQCKDPIKGLVSEGLFPEDVDKDPKAGYFYYYSTTPNRQKYVLIARLEHASNSSFAINDGGVCGNFYEIGNAVGIINPHVNNYSQFTKRWLNLLGISCN